MRQVLLSIGGFSLHTYGVLIALGFLLGIILAAREARRVGLEPARVLDLCFWILVSGLCGARLLYIVTNLPDYAGLCREGVHEGARSALWKCSAVLHIWEGGLVFYGGFLGAMALVLWYVRRHQMGFLRTADLLAPSLAIGHFWGRIGCYAAGCCWGRPCALGWGARFPRGSLVFDDLTARGLMAAGAARTPPLHPTQLYEAGGELAIFFLLLALRRRKRFHGQVLLGYLMLYPVLRSLVEVFRGDAARKFVIPGALSTSQFVSILVMGGAVALAASLARRDKIAS
jgi:phosphatidylglycerol---prolipoprotein diacylglyceryl transferase